MSLSAGDKAPCFSLQDTAGREVSLSSFEGMKNLVILFFPLAFSKTCTEELCRTRDNMKLYDALEAEVIAISVDSFFALREFKKAQNLNFTLLSDFNRMVCREYGVLDNDFYGMEGVARRAAFVIDKEGLIRYREVLEDADRLPDFEQVQSTLSQIT